MKTSGRHRDDRHVGFQDWVVRPAAIGDGDAAGILSAYFSEIVGRYHGRRATRAEVDKEMAEDPSEDLVPPRGLFLLGWHRGTLAGCVGVHSLTPAIAEVKRMFVRPESRGEGGGGVLLVAVEDHARSWGATAMRLDTRHDLVEARALYARHGYREIPPYNNEPYTDHWFEKSLVSTHEQSPSL